MRGIIPTKVHGIIDYVVGAALIVAPWLFGFADATQAGTMIPVILGAGIILYSLLTRYELGVVPLIPMPAHLAFDVIGGLFLAASPWLFNFADIVWAPHLIVGVMDVGIAVMTHRVPGHFRGHHVVAA